MGVKKAEPKPSQAPICPHRAAVLECVVEVLERVLRLPA